MIIPYPASPAFIVTSFNVTFVPFSLPPIVSGCGLPYALLYLSAISVKFSSVISTFLRVSTQRLAASIVPFLIVALA